MLIERSFQRNARGFSDHLSSLFTRTITPNDPLRYSFPGGNQALLSFRNGYAALGRAGFVRFIQIIGPNTEDKQKVTTLEYSYALVIGSNPEAEPLVRYEYVPMEANNPAYRYPIGHFHVDALAPSYDAYIASHEDKPLRSIHFPTGRIAVEDFIELLIVEFHVPVVNNDPALAIRILQESRDTFRKDKQTKP